MNKSQKLDYEENEISLKELFLTIWNNKNFIVVFTLFIMAIAVIFILTRTPVFEVKAILKIGEYKINTNSNNIRVYLDKGKQLSKELEIIFIELSKNAKDRNSWINNISLINGQENLIEIISLGTSPEKAIEKVSSVVKFVQKKHEKNLNEIRDKRLFDIESINRSIKRFKEKELPVLEKQINQYQKDLKIYEKNFLDTQKNLKKLKLKAPTLAVLEINQQRYLIETITSFKETLIDLEAKRYDIENRQLIELEQQQEVLKNLLLPHNYSNSQIIGEYIVNYYPIKPKKQLIITMAFVTGLILSIFLALF